MSVDSFVGLNQNDDLKISDADGDQLDINTDGSVSSQIVDAGGDSLNINTDGSVSSQIVDAGGDALDINADGSLNVTGNLALEGKRPTPLGFATVNVGATAVGLPSIPAGAELALVTAISGSLNWRDDGVAPTTGTTGGQPLFNNVQQKFDVLDLSDLQFIRRGTGGTTDLIVTYYQYV